MNELYVLSAMAAGHIDEKAQHGIVAGLDVNRIACPRIDSGSATQIATPLPPMGLDENRRRWETGVAFDRT
jgi:hypothetical protein